MKRILSLFLLIIMTFTLSGNIKGSFSIPSTYEQPIFELRGAWVSTVSNLDIGMQQTIEQYKEQYIEILDTFEKFHMNAVFFQVRPTNDAFYESEINPWSTFLAGSQGKDPGWDPLPWLVEVTHERGMEFHAWLNPYRVTLDVFSNTDLTEAQYQSELTKALADLDDKNFAKENPDLLIQGGKRILLNPAKEEVRQHIYDTIFEIIDKYDVDAIHFDDYFYTEVKLSSDKELYLQDNNLTASEYVEYQHKDWRREQVNILISGIHDLITEFNEENNRDVQFGISPAAGWAPAISSTCPAYPNGYAMEGGMEGYPCYGYSSYNDLYADTRKWVKEEWLDYILPQNYFELGRYHEEITDWWSRQVEGTTVKLYMGIGLYQFENYSYLKADEYISQFRFNQQYKNVEGLVIFSYRSLTSPKSSKWNEGVELINEYWNVTPLLPSLVNDKEVVDTQVDTATVVRKNHFIELNFISDDDAIGYAIYRFDHQNSPDFDTDNIISFVANKSDELQYTDEVENSKQYDYYIKAVLNDGSLSSQYKKIVVSDIFINEAPEIKEFTIQGGDLFNAKSNLYIDLDVYDANGDTLTVFFEFSTNNGIRYRYKQIVDVGEGKTQVTYKLPSDETFEGRLRLSVSDGDLETTMVSKQIIIVNEDMSKLEQQFYNTLYKLEQKIKIIYGEENAS